MILRSAFIPHVARHMFALDKPAGAGRPSLLPNHIILGFVGGRQPEAHFRHALPTGSCRESSARTRPIAASPAVRGEKSTQTQWRTPHLAYRSERPGTPARAVTPEN